MALFDIGFVLNDGIISMDHESYRYSFDENFDAFIKTGNPLNQSLIDDACYWVTLAIHRNPKTH